jgi:hypothetical protein
MVDTPKLVALMPSRDHGDTDDNPSPTPRINMINDKEAPAAAPATMAPHETALVMEGDITGLPSARLSARFCDSNGAVGVMAMAILMNT